MQARFVLRLTRHGRVIAERRTRNTVMASGAQIVAALFAGSGVPVTHMAVGISDAAPEDTGLTALTNAGEEALTGEVLAAVAPASIRFETDDLRRLVRVHMRATLPNAAAIGTIREAGLIARRPDPDGDTLYNRVTFAPVLKQDDHELTLFWEVEFPFGDLSSLA
jgi:hypothetical protein